MNVWPHNWQATNEFSPPGYVVCAKHFDGPVEAFGSKYFGRGFAQCSMSVIRATYWIFRKILELGTFLSAVELDPFDELR